VCVLVNVYCTVTEVLLNLTEVFLNLTEVLLNLTEVLLNLTEVLLNLTEFFLNLTEVFLNLTEVFLTLTEMFLTLTEVSPCFFLSFKINARLKLAKTGHGPHSSTLVVIYVVRLLFVLFYVLFVCKCVLPPGYNQIAVNP